MTRERAIQILDRHGSCWENGESIPAGAMMEALQMAVEALKAQEPVKPVFRQCKIFCGRCGIAFPKDVEHYCPNCGQAVKWCV